jgi:GT2 family glycosyltransferase
MISIIIPTKNDLDLGNTLESVTKANKPEKTEIIVIDASKKETLLDIKKKFPKVKWFYYKNKTGKKRTFVEQLNVGTAKAKGDILVFVDGGCTVDKNWLIELTKPILKNEEDFVVGAIKSYAKSHHNWYEGLKYLKFCGTANTAMRKEVIQKVGQRDENFSYGSDVDFSWRAVDAGYKIRYIPKAVMYHDWGSLKQDIKRAYRYGIARVKLYKKHHRELIPLLCYLGFFVYIISIVPVSLFFPWYSLLILVHLVTHIKNNPFKRLIFDLFYGLGVFKELIFYSNHKKQKR